MGFSVSGSTALIFLGVLIATGTLYDVTSYNVEIIGEAVDDRNERLRDMQNTNIEVVSARYYEANSSLIVAVENTGSTTLFVSETTLLVDNQYSSLEGHTTVESNPGTDIWGEDETLEISIASFDEPPQTIKVVASYGISDFNSTVQ